MPAVSVIIPAYNAAAFIADTLDSVMNQSLADFEVVVVDDGSTDGTADIVKDRYPGVRCVSQPNGGVSSARNLGVKMAEGEFIAFLDADDEWHPDKLRAQVALMRAYPQSHLSRTAIAEEPLGQGQLLFSGQPDGLPDHWLITSFAESFLNPYFATSAVVVRRDAFLGVGGFDRTLKVAEDVDLYLRILAKAPTVPFVKGVALHKRMVKGSLGDDSEEGYTQLLLVYQRFIDGHAQVVQSLGRSTVDKAFATLWARYAGSQFRNGKRLPSIKAALRSLGIQSTGLGWRVLLRAVRP